MISNKNMNGYHIATDYNVWRNNTITSNIILYSNILVYFNYPEKVLVSSYVL